MSFTDKNNNKIKLLDVAESPLQTPPRGSDLHIKYRKFPRGDIPNQCGMIRRGDPSGTHLTIFATM